MMGEEEIGTIFLRSEIKEATAFLSMSMVIVTAVLVISLFLCWIGAARLRRSIADPLELLVQGAASMATGDLSTQVAVRSADETGVLARAFNAMVDSLRGLVSLISENTRYVAEAMGKLTAASAAMREQALRQEEAVESTAESIAE